MNKKFADELFGGLLINMLSIFAYKSSLNLIAYSINSFLWQCIFCFVYIAGVSFYIARSVSEEYFDFKVSKVSSLKHTFIYSLLFFIWSIPLYLVTAFFLQKLPNYIHIFIINEIISLIIIFILIYVNCFKKEREFEWMKNSANEIAKIVQRERIHRHIPIEIAMKIALDIGVGKSYNAKYAKLIASFFVAEINKMNQQDKEIDDEWTQLYLSNPVKINCDNIAIDKEHASKLYHNRHQK